MKRRTFMAAAMTTAAVLGMVGAVTPGIGTQPGLAATASSPWSQTNSNAALSRANLTEKVLSRAAVIKVKYLRSVVAPPHSLEPAACPWQAAAAAPVLAGGYLYAITSGKISKYNAATGSLIWRKTPTWPSTTNRWPYHIISLSRAALFASQQATRLAWSMPSTPPRARSYGQHTTTCQ